MMSAKSTQRPGRCPGPQQVSRREILKVGAASALGLGLPALLRADALRRSQAQPAADACVLIFLNGGPSHLDMWDMKPLAPREIRGEFKPIATSVPGVQFSEHLPRLARHMHQCTLIRSVHHSVNNAHAAAVYVGLTGHDRGDANIAISTGPDDYPAIGSVMSVCRPPRLPVVPFVSLPYITQEGAGGPPQPGFFGGRLGRSQDPLFVLRDPNTPGFAMPELVLSGPTSTERLHDRMRLMANLAERSSGASSRRLQELGAFQAKAVDLLTSAATRKAFAIEEEPDKTRQLYGRNIYGQSVLLARRLVEAGTRVVSIAWAPDANATWDTHGSNFANLKNRLLPPLDMAVSALLNDLSSRGLMQRTLVAVMGEFGRSPRVNPAAGRDHWNFCYTLMLAGGGVKGGYVYGSSDRIGGQPSNLPVTPADVIATIYRCLGLPHDLELMDKLQRPLTLVPWGNPLLDVLA